ncbi:hypothetical protein [Actomonas aquatica]|uniref:Lipoprotein n=1 Tax=Actomonas aquatica TaxID=2866162 RepID=A0ABZ1C4Y6_9BACT|nr:hypothetical protein [Opitutus sp. WL0086]WRQ86420.1 hypothetical protein K1X11_016515 [Opitutus sp. WL0086]
MMKILFVPVLMLGALLLAAGCGLQRTGGAQSREGEICLVGEGEVPTLATARARLNGAGAEELRAWLARQQSGWRRSGRADTQRGLHLVLQREADVETHVELVGNTLWMQGQHKALDREELRELWSIIGPQRRVPYLADEIWAM